MDARNIPGLDVFDLTGAFDVIEHITDDEGVLRGLHAATQTGGGIIVAVPKHPWLWSCADDAARHQRRYRRGELEAKLRRHSFGVFFSSSFTALLLPLKAASRLIGGGNKRHDDVFHEFRLNRHLNDIFTSAINVGI
jgi:hypothetical protein